jgi:hypothetical protein
MFTADVLSRSYIHNSSNKKIQRTRVADGQLGMLDKLRLVIVNMPFLKLHSSNSRKHFGEHLFNLGQPDRIVSFNSIST